MKIIIRIAVIVICVLTISCIKPSKILIPPEFRHIPAQPVIGGQNSWKIQFGEFLFYNFLYRGQKVLYITASTQFKDIISYEFVGELKDKVGQNCYCEFPLQTFIDPNIKCTQLKQNTFIHWGIIDSTLSFDGNILIIEPYSLTEVNTKTKNYILGYIFKESDKVMGFLDVSKKYDETVWIVPDVDTPTQNAIASAMVALIIKHRKWYEEFYKKVDRETSIKGF